MKKIIPLNYSPVAQLTLEEGHERFMLAPAQSKELPKITYRSQLRNLPTKTQKHPADREVGKDEIAKAGGGSSLNALKGGKYTPHGIYRSSSIDRRSSRLDPRSFN